MKFKLPFKIVSNRDAAPVVEATVKAQTRSIFAGANFSRLTNDWVASYLSPDQEIIFELLALRSRARDLEKNNTYASRYLDLVSTYVVGANGIKLQARIKDSTGELDTVTNQTIEDAFEDWAECASLDGKFSWQELQSLAIKTCARDGEVFIQIIRGDAADNEWGFALRIIEGDYLNHLLNQYPAGTSLIPDSTRSNQTNEIRSGVEIDRNGKPVAYHFWERHPSERGGGRYIAIPADDIIHLYDPYSAHQTRGVTWLKSSMTNLHMLYGAMEANLVAARAAAAKMGFLEQPKDADNMHDPNAAGPQIGPNEHWDASPGTIQVTPPGFTFKEFNPTNPGASFLSFAQVILHSVAAALNVTYASLTTDGSMENYSSLRGLSIVEKAHWKGKQHWMIRSVHKRVYCEWMQSVLLYGSLKLRSRDASNYLSVAFRPPTFAEVDPQKEASANDTNIGLGLTSRTKLLDERGIDIEDVFAELAREKEMADKYDISIDGVKMKLSESVQGPPAVAKPTEEAPAPDPTEDPTNVDNQE